MKQDNVRSEAALRVKLQDQLAYPPRLMNAARAAAYIGFGPTKFLEMVDDGVMPAPLDVGGSPRWDRFELDSAVENIKDRRRNPVTRDRDRLARRIQEQEARHEMRSALRDRAA